MAFTRVDIDPADLQALWKHIAELSKRIATLENSNEPRNTKADIFFGHAKIDSRFRRDGDQLIGEGRSQEFDRDGTLVRDSGWQPTGVKVILRP